MPLNIVLIEPEIPNNTGNIGRLALASGSNLHLVKPFGFEITDARLKRAGLDYWGDLDLIHHDNFEAWYSSLPENANVYFFSARATQSLYKQTLKEGDYLVFGKEATGLGEELIKRFESQLLTIPFPGKVRSFNLGNAVAMVLGEGMSQIDFESLSQPD